MHNTTKRYVGIPFIHRVFLRGGGDSHIHGHVWEFEFEFACDSLDANGFVIDFNALQQLEGALNSLNGRLVMSAFDPAISVVERYANLFSLVVVPDASSEGLAHHFYALANRCVAGERGVRCVRCSVFEDRTNSASFREETVAITPSP